MGVHQRIDRLARRELIQLFPRKKYFPSEHDILHFEGLNGPDGIKRKSPGQDEPWHYVDPTNHADESLKKMIRDHMHNLAVALSERNDKRAAFEAAWMAHAIVDGLTPAHHYPLEEKLEELRDGQGLETRNTPRKKILLPGKTRRHQLRNNWEFWGAKGVMTTHVAFELGVATTLAAGGRLPEMAPTSNEIVRVKNDGVEPLFEQALHKIVGMGLYEEFSRSGWTRRLASETKQQLIPEIVKLVTLAWYESILMAEKRAAKK